MVVYVEEVLSGFAQRLGCAGKTLLGLGEVLGQAPGAARVGGGVGLAGIFDDPQSILQRSSHRTQVLLYLLEKLGERIFKFLPHLFCGVLGPFQGRAGFAALGLGLGGVLPQAEGALFQLLSRGL